MTSKPGGMMPTTSHDRPLRLTVWPTTSRPPNTACQVSCDSIATSGPPVRVSSAVKCRPRAAGTPSVFSSAASTLPVRTRLGRSLADRFSSPVVNAPTRENDRFHSVNSKYSGGETQN